MPWPLAVSSLGMPEADLPTFLDLAAQHGCTGVELRTAPGQPVDVALSAPERAEARRQVGERGLTVIDLASYVRLCQPGADAPVVADLVEHLRLAADMGARGVRVFPGGAGDGRDDERGRRRLAAVLDQLGDTGVEVLVETHDSHRSGAAVARLLGPLATRPGIGVVWDVLHTWRAGEPPTATALELGPLLRVVQVKDAVGPGDDDPLTLPGKGSLPVGDVLHALDDTGYAGWLSLEWERPWSPDLPDLATALAATRRWLGADLEPVGGAG